MKHPSVTFSLLFAIAAASSLGSPTAPRRVCALPDDTGYHASRFAKEVAHDYMVKATPMLVSLDAQVRTNGSVLMDEGMREFVRASRLLICHRRGIIDPNCFDDSDRVAGPDTAVCR